MILVVAVCFGFGFLPISFLAVLTIDREKAYDLITQNLSNFGSLMGIGLAILAIIFTIIQISYKRLTIIQIVIENTYFIPLFYYGAINIGLSSFLLLLRHSEDILATFSYARIAVVETYLFFAFVIGMCVVFYRTLQFINFENILRLYLNQNMFLLRKEKKSSLSPSERERLEENYLELTVEVEHQLSERKIRTLYTMMEHFRSAITLNHNSIFLSEYANAFSQWFTLGILTREKRMVRAMYEEWYKLYNTCLDPNDRNKLWFANQLPINVFAQYLSTKDHNVRLILQDGVLIRIKEYAVFGFFSLSKNGGSPITKEIILYYDVAETFQELLHQFVRENEFDLLNQTLIDLKSGKQFLGADDDYDEMEDPNLELIAKEKQELDWLAHAHLLANYFYEMPFYSFCYLCYSIAEGQVPWSEKKPIFESLLIHLIRKQPSKIVLMAIKMFEQSDSYPRMPIHDWVRSDQLVQDGKAYFMENSEVILAIGLLALFSSLILEDINLSQADIEAAESFVRNIKTTITRYENNDHLVYLLRVADTTEVGVKLEFVNQFLDNIKAGADHYREIDLIQTPLSQDRITAFREMIYQQWEEGRDISRLFESTGATVLNPDKEDKLYYVGMHRINLKGGRSYFIENQRQHFVGDFSFGHRTNDQVIELFWRAVKQNAEIQKSQFHTMILGLDFIIENFPFITHVVCPWLLYQQHLRSLTESGHFASKDDQIGKVTSGVFKDRLELIPLRRRANPNEIIGLKLPGSVVLQQRTSDAWMDGKLQVDVIEINDTNVDQTLLKSTPPGDPNDPKQVQKAKTGVILEIDETMNFKVLDPTNVVIITIN